MPVRFYFNDNQVGAKLRDKVLRRKASARQAIRDAAHDAAEAIEQHGRADLQTAGNFGAWAPGFNARVTEGGGHVRISVTMGEPAPFYWIVHQEGRTIHGNPFLWFRPTGEWAAHFGNPDVISVRQVTIPKRLHLVEISQTVARGFKVFLHERLVNG